MGLKIQFLFNFLSINICFDWMISQMEMNHPLFNPFNFRNRPEIRGLMVRQTQELKIIPLRAKRVGESMKSDTKKFRPPVY